MGSKLSVLIPAYNNNASLFACICSLARQTIARDISVIISDDFSPKPIMTEIVNTFKDYFYKIELTRRKTNLGVVSNKSWLFSQVNSKYFAYMEHDDWLVRDDMYERAIKSLENREEVGCFFGNAFIEPYWDIVVSGGEGFCVQIPNPLDKNFMYNLNDKHIKSLITVDGYLNGKDFAEQLSLSSETQKFNTSWSSIVIKTNSMRKLGGFGSGYTLTPAESSALKVFGDEEHFCCLMLIASQFDFRLEDIPSVIRGFSFTAYSKDLFGDIKHSRRKYIQDGAFYAYYKLAWIISRQGQETRTKQIIKSLYRLCEKIGLIHETKYSEEFLKAYQPSLKEYKEFSEHTIKKSRRAIKFTIESDNKSA